jgi:hypothetical protein
MAFRRIEASTDVGRGIGGRLGMDLTIGATVAHRWSVNFTLTARENRNNC